MSLTLTVTALNQATYTHYSVGRMPDNPITSWFYDKNNTKVTDMQVRRINRAGEYEQDQTVVTHISFSSTDDAAIRAIASNHNITIDSVRLHLPPKREIAWDTGADALLIGSNLTTMDKWDAQNSTLVYSNPYSSTDTGKWVDINPQAIADYVGENGHSLIIIPAGTGDMYYNNLTKPLIQIVITYHYHNSELTLSSSSAAFGGTITSNLTTYLASYTHTIEYKLNDSAKTTVTLAAGTTSHTFTIPSNWMNQIPSATSATITVTLTTYDGSTVVGDLSTANLIATVPASVVPSPGSIAYSVSNPLAVPITNRGLTASLSGQAGVYSSTIRSYTLQGEGFTSINQALVIDPIQRIASQSQSRTLAVTATVTDSRGRSASTTLNITVYEWDVPYFSALEYYRCNSYGTKSEDGTYLRIACTYACFPVTVGSTNKNSITAHTYKIVSKDGSTTIAQGTLSGSAQVVGGGNLSADEEYYLQLTLTDGVTTIVYQYLIYSSAYVIHFRNGGTGVAFGQAADANNTVKINPNWVLIIGNNIDVGAKLANLESRIAALE